MDWEDLRDQWQARTPGAIDTAALRPPGRVRLWQRVRRRDAVETLVALPMIPFFAATSYKLWTGGLWIPSLFALILLAVVTWIPIRLWHARRSIPEPDPGGTVLAFLTAERAALVVQAELLSTVARWYWGPIAFGVIGLSISIRGLSWASLAYAGFVVALCTVIEMANRAAVRSRFVPAIESVERQIEEINKKVEDENSNY